MEGNVIRQVLIEHGLKLADVARDLKVSPQHLNNKFASVDVKIGTIMKFVEVTKIPLIEFLFGCPKIRKEDPNFTRVYFLYENSIKVKN